MLSYRAGGRRALDELFAALKTPLYAFLYRLSRNVEMAEDLLQETLVTICTRSETWDPTRPVRPWVYTIARNKFLEWRRREKKIIPLKRPERVSGPANFGQPNENRVSLQVALATLNEPIREAFLLKHFSELPFDEVAEIQGVPVPTAKSRVRFAIQKLRGLLGDEHV